MSKSIAIIETPKNCANCPLYSFEGHICRVNSKTILNIGSIAEFCPLKPMPEMKEIGKNEDEVSEAMDVGYVLGWNTCIEEIENVN